MPLGAVARHLVRLVGTQKAACRGPVPAVTETAGRLLGSRCWVDGPDSYEVGAEIWGQEVGSRGVGEDFVRVGRVLASGVGPGGGHGESEFLQWLGGAGQGEGEGRDFGALIVRYCHVAGAVDGIGYAAGWGGGLRVDGDVERGVGGDGAEGGGGGEVVLVCAVEFAVRVVPGQPGGHGAEGRQGLGQGEGMGGFVEGEEVDGAGVVGGVEGCCVGGRRQGEREETSDCHLLLLLRKRRIERRERLKGKAVVKPKRWRTV